MKASNMCKLPQASESKKSRKIKKKARKKLQEVLKNGLNQLKSGKNAGKWVCECAFTVIASLQRTTIRRIERNMGEASAACRGNVYVVHSANGCVYAIWAKPANSNADNNKSYGERLPMKTVPWQCCACTHTQTWHTAQNAYVLAQTLRIRLAKHYTNLAIDLFPNSEQWQQQQQQQQQ